MKAILYKLQNVDHLNEGLAILYTENIKLKEDIPTMSFPGYEGIFTVPMMEEISSEVFDQISDPATQLVAIPDHNSFFLVCLKWAME